MQWKRSKYYKIRVFACSPRYPAWNANVSYCRLWPVRLYYVLELSTISHKRHDFRQNLLKIKCLFRIPLQLLSEIFFIIKRHEQDIITNVNWSSCQVPVPVVRVKSYLNFLDRFSKYTQISDLVKIRPVGAELFHANRRKNREARQS